MGAAARVVARGVIGAVRGLGSGGGSRRVRATVHGCLVASAALGAAALFTVSVVDAVAAEPPPFDAGLYESIKRDWERAEQDRESAASEADRLDSRTAYRDLSDAEAQDAAREEFRELLTAPIDLDLEDLAGSSPSFVNDFVAEVELDGKTTLVEGTLPLRDKDRSGEVAPIDLELQERATTFASVNPLVNVDFPKDAGRGIALPDLGVSIAPWPASDAAPELSGDRLFWPNVAADTDLAAMPVQTGFETVHFLRSPASPEELRLRVSMPDGATLAAVEPAAGGAAGSRGSGAEVRRGDEVLARITPPAAVDADGTSVQVVLVVEGSDLVLRVEHRNRDYRYPIAVDPVVQGDVQSDYEWWYFGNQNIANWLTSVSTGGIQTIWAWDIGKTYAGWGFGPYITNNASVQPGSFGQFFMNAWGDASIYYVSTNHVHHEFPPGGNPSNASAIALGIWDYGVPGVRAAGWETPPYFTGASFNNSSIELCAQAGTTMANCPPTGGYPSNAFIFRMHKDWGGIGHAYMGMAHVFQADNVKPTLYQTAEHYLRTGSTLKPNADKMWLNGSAPLATNVFVRDTGFGSRSAQVRIPTTSGVAYTPTVNRACRGSDAEGNNPQISGAGPPCDRDYAARIDYSIRSDMPEGILTGNIARGFDLARNYADSTFTLKVDQTAPKIELSGRLYRDRKGSTGDETLNDEQYTLSIDATEGTKTSNPGTLANSARRSGVASLRVDILKKDSSATVAECENGSVSESSYELVKNLGDNTNPNDNADMAGNVDFRPDAYAPGTRLVRVQATDRAEPTANVGRKCFEIEIVREPRTGRLGYFSMTGLDLTDRLRVSVNNANGNLLAQNTDLSLRGVGMDVVLGRVYNSWYKDDDLGGSGPEDDDVGEFGPGWHLSLGPSVKVVEESGSSAVTLRGPTGYRVRYTNPHLNEATADADDQIFDRPFGVPAKLVQPDGLSGGYELRWFRQGVRWIFSATGTLDRIVDQNDNMIELTYTSGRLTKLEGGLVNGSADVRRRRTINLAYTGARVTSISEPQLGRSYSYSYDATGRLDTVTDPAGAVVNYDYNPDGRLSKVTDGRNQATDISYESGAPAYARVVSVQRAADQTGARPLVQFRWNEDTTQPSEGEANIVRGPRHTSTLNAEFRYVTNTEDRVRRVRAPDPDPNDTNKNGQILDRGFDAAGNVNSFTSGETTNLDYRGAENLETVTRGGQSGTLSYSDAGAPNYATRSTDTNGHSQSYGYNTVGRQDLVSVQNQTSGATAAESARTELPRNSDGTIDKVIRDQGAERVTTDYQYSPEAEIERINYPAGSGESVAPLADETFSYDNASRLDDYDAMDRVSKVTYASNDSISYGYDPNGNLTSVTDKRGGSTFVTTSYTIDSLNRLVTEARGGTTVQSYSYDLNDNLKSHTEGGRTTSYTFDHRDLMTSLADQEGKLTCFDHSDEHRRVTSVRIEPTSCATPSSARVTIDPDYDPDDGRLVSLNVTDSAGARIEKFEYGYRDDDAPTGAPDGSLKQWVRDRDQNRCIDWDYDTLGRLVDARVTNNADDCDFDRNGSATQVDRWQYEYDNAGNLVKKTHNGSVTTYRVNSRDQLCWEASGTPSGNCSNVPSGGVDYDYDNAGNLLNASGRYQLAYDERYRTNTITPAGATAQTQTYTGEGQSERLTSGAASFLYGRLGLGWASISSVGTGDALTAGKTVFTRAADGSLVSQRKPDGTKEYFIFDGHPGSVVALVNPAQTVATGMVKARYRYDPYGNNTLKTGISDTPWRFAGAWFDRFPGPASEQKGLYKMGERYYDARSGRWTQRDPVDHKDDLRQGNRYSYGGGDPINQIDPTGLDYYHPVEREAYFVLGTVAAVGGVLTGGAAVAIEASCGEDLFESMHCHESAVLVGQFSAASFAAAGGSYYRGWYGQPEGYKEGDFSSCGYGDSSCST